MPLKFAGVDLSPLTPQLAQLMDRWWVREAPSLWDWPGYEMDRMHHLPVPSQPSHEPASLNTLVWPTGASRWASFYCLVGGSQAESILSAIGTDAPTFKKLSLTDTDNNQTVETDMFCLGLRPVFVQEAEASVWLVQLVDERYFWWTQRLTYTFDQGGTWSDLITSLHTATNSVGSLTLPTIPAAYGKPSHLRWTNRAHPLPLLIDAAVNTIGMRFIRRLDGTKEVVTATGSDTEDEIRYNIHQSHLAMGGRVEVEALKGNIPEKVAVAFWGDNQALNLVTLASLALTEFDTITGVPGTYGWVAADMYAAAVGADKTAYANQAATDYYRWLLSRTDATFRGIRFLNSTGQEDRIEWEYMPGRQDDVETEPITGPLSKRMPWERCVTRIVRTSWGDSNVYGDRPPPGYTYLVKLLTNKAPESPIWKATIQVVKNDIAIGDGPQLGFGDDEFVLFSRGNPNLPGSGDFGVAIPDPLVAGRWLFAPMGGTAGPTQPCITCGWLTDADALQVQAGRGDPKRVLSYKKYEGVGRCTCIDQPEGTDPNNPFQAFWDGADSWDGMRMLHDCCGCDKVSFFIPGDGTYPPISATFDGTKSCTDGNTFTYDLLFQCCTDDSAWFTAAGPKLCSGSPPFPCDNSYLIQVTCDGCAMTNVACDECQEIGAPPVLKIPTTGFTGTYAVYNGPWFLPFISDSVTDPCLWSITCGGITVMAQMLRVGNDSVLRVTYSGGPGTVVYEYVETNANLFCFVDHTLNVVSGDTADTPDQITEKGIYCETSPNFCAEVWKCDIILYVTNQTGTCSCIPGQPIKVSQVTSPGYAATWGIENPPCANSGQIVLACAGGRLSVSVSGGVNATVVEVSRAVNPFVYVVDVTWNGNPTNPCSGSVRMTFTCNPNGNPAAFQPIIPPMRQLSPKRNNTGAVVMAF